MPSCSPLLAHVTLHRLVSPRRRGITNYASAQLPKPSYTGRATFTQAKPMPSCHSQLKQNTKSGDEIESTLLASCQVRTQRKVLIRRNSFDTTPG